jgi:hypothetical protein
VWRPASASLGRESSGNTMLARWVKERVFFPFFLDGGFFFELLPQKAKCKSDTSIKSAVCELLLKIFLADSAFEF